MIYSVHLVGQVLLGSAAPRIEATSRGGMLFDECHITA